MQANPIRQIGSWAELSPQQHEGFPAHEAAVRIRLGNLA
jgi:hypothetical protein